MSMWRVPLQEAVLVLSGWELVGPAAAVAHHPGGRGLIPPFPAYSSKHHSCKSTREYPARPGHSTGLLHFRFTPLWRTSDHPPLKVENKAAFGRRSPCTQQSAAFVTLRLEAWREEMVEENATSVENCWHLNYLPTGTGSNFPLQHIKIGSALKEQFCTIWKCCHYIHDWSSFSNSRPREAVDRKDLGHRFAKIYVAAACVCFGKMLFLLFTTQPSVPGSIPHLYCGVCWMKTLLIKSHFPSFVFADGETDLLEMHAFRVQFNLIDRECILNLKV